MDDGFPARGNTGRSVAVKNRAPAPIQITAEQILREAKERQGETRKIPRQRITDTEELNEYRMGKRRDFEDTIRRQRQHLGTWMKYAKWEESQEEFQRARSVYERAIDVDYKSPSLWLKYAEMEMKHKFINHARNVWDRAVTLLPRVDQFWYKYAYMEEMLGNRENARQVFDRWMEWDPSDQAWFSYIKFEVRGGDLDRARAIQERFLIANGKEFAYIKFAKWEEKQKQPLLCRNIFTRALEELREDEISENLYLEFASFETRCREFDRARAIYQYALEHLPKEETRILSQEFISFEKQYGNQQGIERVLLEKRRLFYEEAVKATPLDYDSWMDYIRLEESYEDQERIRQVYERAIANLPPKKEKKYWRRYIYLWINYAIYEELVADNTERTRLVYKKCLEIIPHKHFTFAKIWILAAKFEIRQKDLAGARKLLGNAIGKTPKNKLFTSYIHMELQLGEIERCRKLYEKFLEFGLHQCKTWQSYAQLEKNVGEIERARAIFELAINQPLLDMPEVLWKAYIDFEIEMEEKVNTRMLYERLLERTKHVKVWISFAQFEKVNEEDEFAREIYDRGYKHLKQSEQKEQVVMLLESWLEFEEEKNNKEKIETLRSMMPKKMNKKRMVYAEDGSERGWEEYVDYVFPDDEKGQSTLKLLQAAQLWKKRAREEQEQNQEINVSN